MHRLRSPLAVPFLLAGLLVSTAAIAEEEEKPKDVEGSRDHPAVKRYPDSIIVEFTEKEFETFKLPIGDPKNGDGQAITKTVEGKYLDLIYQFPVKVSCTQIRRNYENAFKAAGMTVHPGKSDPWSHRGWGGTNLGWVSAEGKVAGKGSPLYILATCWEGDTPGGNLIVVESAAMEQKVEVDAGAMAQEIEKTGRVALYGVNFATGKADITPDSARSLEQIATLLKNKPDWRLRVEGHTDNVGKAKDNLGLSKRRAAAVMAYLVSKHGVAAGRLVSEGFGDSKPLMPNDTDDGKAKNRRVELSKL